MSTLQFSLHIEQWLVNNSFDYLGFFLLDKLFLLSIRLFNIVIFASWPFFRKRYITFRYLSKFINIKFNIKKYQDKGEFHSFNGLLRWNRAVYEHFHIYYKCKISYKDIFWKDVENPSITCLDYLHVRQSYPPPHPRPRHNCFHEFNFL